MFRSRIVHSLKSYHHFKTLSNFRSFASKDTTVSDTKVDNINISYQGFQTVDSSEVNFASKLSERWWSDTDVMVFLKLMNEIRVPFIRDCLLENCTKLKGVSKNDALPLKNCDIIDVGCGGGLLSEPLAILGGNVTGLDASKPLIEVAKEHAKSSNVNNVNYVHDVIENFSEQNHEKYDALVLSEVIEHITEKELFMKCCLKTVRPGGSIIITTFNKTKLSWIAGILLAEHIFRLIPVGTHQWSKFISPEDMSLLLNKYNCETKSVRGIKLSFFDRKWYWTNKPLVSYALHSIKKSN